MWMPKDTATWLAVIALILVIPFNFFSSWAYPKLQNWWAARSRKSLQKRIDKLTTLIARMNERRAMPLRDELVLLCAEKLGWLIFSGVVVLAFIEIILSAPVIRSAPHPNRIIVALSITLVAYKSLKDFFMVDIEGYRRFAGSIIKIDLERSLEKLEAKLAAREHRKPART
jgi:hypothetical protein